MEPGSCQASRLQPVRYAIGGLVKLAVAPWQPSGAPWHVGGYTWSKGDLWRDSLQVGALVLGLRMEG